MEMQIKNNNGDVAGTIDCDELIETLKDEISNAHLADGEVAELKEKAERADDLEAEVARMQDRTAELSRQLAHLHTSNGLWDLLSENVPDWSDEDFYRFWEEARKHHSGLRPIMPEDGLMVITRGRPKPDSKNRLVQIVR